MAFLQTQPRMTSSELVPLASSLMIRQNAWGYAKRLRYVASQLRPGDRVLDVGCGNGSQLAIPLARSGVDVTGIDPHRESIERARAWCLTANFLCGYLHELPAQKFDVIILSEVLEHLSEPAALLLCAREYLAVDGRIIVTVPNGYGEFEWDWWLCRKLNLVPRIEAMFAFIRRLRGRPDPVVDAAGSDCADGHVQFFTLRQVQRVFERASLSIRDRRPGSLCCGPLAAYVLAHSRTLTEWNASVTDYLPFAFASDWYFTLVAEAPSGQHS